MSLFEATTSPTSHQLRAWWDTMRADKSGTAWFSDAFPRGYTDFVAVLESGLERCALFMRGDDVAGAYWLHDMHAPDGEHPAYAWVRGYVSPSYRGTFTERAWPVARQLFADMGFAHIFAASHPKNKAAHYCLTMHMHFVVVGTYEPFCSFAGKPGACMVYAMNQGDSELAKMDAAERVRQCLQNAA